MKSNYYGLVCCVCSMFVGVVRYRKDCKSFICKKCLTKEQKDDFIFGVNKNGL